MINKDNVLVHEWIGLNARIRKSTCRGMEEIRGKIVDETKNTLLLEDENGNMRTIPKKTCVFELELWDEWVKIDGSSVCYAPEERLKKLFRKKG